MFASRTLFGRVVCWHRHALVEAPLCDRSDEKARDVTHSSLGKWITVRSGFPRNTHCTRLFVCAHVRQTTNQHVLNPFKTIQTSRLVKKQTSTGSLSAIVFLPRSDSSMTFPPSLVSNGCVPSDGCRSLTGVLDDAVRDDSGVTIRD